MVMFAKSNLSKYFKMTESIHYVGPSKKKSSDLVKMSTSLSGKYRNNLKGFLYK